MNPQNSREQSQDETAKTSSVPSMRRYPLTNQSLNAGARKSRCVGNFGAYVGTPHVTGNLKMIPPFPLAAR